MSMLGGIQPGRLRSYLADALEDGPSNDGLIQRFQVMVWPDTRQEWHYVDRQPNLEAEQQVVTVFRHLVELDPDNPVRFRFEPEAQALFIEWLAELEEDWGVPVLRRKENAYPWQLWEWGPFRDLMEHDNEPYVVTDPDVVPSGNCPDDWLERLGEVLARYQCVKVGLSLRIDNVPPERLEEVLAMEHHFWEDGVPPEAPEFYRANTDTTLALYRPFTQYPLFALGPSLRLAPPYSADHLGWHETGELSPELAHYYAHADPGHAAHRTVSP
jgi:hypothetical protein